MVHKVSPIALAAVTSILAFSGFAFAEEAAQPPAGTQAPTGIAPARANVKTIQANMVEKRAELKEAAKDVRSNFKIEVKDVRTNTKAEMREATSSAERRAIEQKAIEQRKGLIETRKENTSTIQDRRKGLIETRKASSTEIRDTRKDLIESRKEKVSEIRDQKKEAARQHIGAIKQRYSIAIRQFESLAVRIQSRIDKMKANGIDATGAESALSLAVVAIAQVKTDAQALADLGAQVNSGDDAKALRAQIETAVKKLNASVKSAHEALVAAGKALIASSRTQKSDTPEPSSSGTPN